MLREGTAPGQALVRFPPGAQPQPLMGAALSALPLSFSLGWQVVVRLLLASNPHSSPYPRASQAPSAVSAEMMDFLLLFLKCIPPCYSTSGGPPNSAV